MTRLIIALSMLCATLTAHDAAAQWLLPTQGETVTGRLTLGGATVLLPPGAWIVGGASREPTLQFNGADLLSVALLQAGVHGVTSVVLAQRNSTMLAQRPELSGECDAHASLFTATPTDDAAGGVCAAVLITRVNTRPDTSAAWRAAAAYASDRHWPLPAALVVAAFRMVDRNSLLDVRYATTLSDTGAATVTTCSGTKTVMNDPATRRRLNGVTRFATALLPVFDFARTSELDAIDAAPPLPTAELPVPDLLTRIKLNRIDAMVRRNVLTKADAETLRRTLPVTGETDSLASEDLSRSQWKSGTYRLAVATGSMGLWTYAAGSPLFALGMVALQNVLIAPMNDGIETGWSTIGPSLGLAPRAFTLPSIGAPCQ